MLQSLRNPLVGIALSIAAILVVALLDGAFQHFFPSLSDLRVGQTNLATCLVMADVVAAFLLAGYLGRRWHSALGWVLLPVVALYAGAVGTAPYFYACSPIRFLWACTITHLPFVIGITAACIGYVVGSIGRLCHMSSNKQLQRTVIPNRWRAASASLHYAHAARWTRSRAAAELRR